VKAATANQVPLLLSKRMLVRDMKRVAERICDCTDPDTARRIAHQIEECLRARETATRNYRIRLQQEDTTLAALLLGLPSGVRDMWSKEDIDAAYRARVRRHHPDSGGDGDVDTLTALDRAYDCLRRRS
jgi:hypothetical protein